jgi:hypothetical protein
MGVHPLIAQLRFARSELVRCLEGVSEADGVVRVGPMNCLSWTVGHLANQEQFFWVMAGQERIVAPGLNDIVGFGMPASTPPLREMWDAWRAVTAAADAYLDTLTPAVLQTYFQGEGKPAWESIGTLLLRNIMHYWFHIGQAHSVREMLGHTNLPEFVGNMAAAAYRPEND